jgi:hypothetical protein
MIPNTNQLEFDFREQAHFESIKQDNARAVYRRLCERLTGSLPSWAQRRKRGPKPKVNATSITAGRAPA